MKENRGYFPSDYDKVGKSHSDIYNPNDVPKIIEKQRIERQLQLFTCPICGKQSLALFRLKQYYECQNINCKAIGVPRSNMTVIRINEQVINVFPPEGFTRR